MTPSNDKWSVRVYQHPRNLTQDTRRGDRNARPRLDQPASTDLASGARWLTVEHRNRMTISQ